MMTENLPLYHFFERISHNDYPSLDFDNTMYFCYAAIFLIIIFACLLILWLIYHLVYDKIDSAKANKQILYGELIDKRYMGEQTTSGTGTMIIPNMNGGIGVGIVSGSSHTDEEFLFFIKADKVYKTEVDMQQFYSYKIGDRISFEVKIGGLSREELGTEILEL
jgi:hypothetical protein